jgi:hypothetical protein
MPDPLLVPPGHSPDNATVLVEVWDERRRQDQKWGEQNHPDLSAWLTPLEPEERSDAQKVRWISLQAARYYMLPMAVKAKEITDTEHREGAGSWFSIHVEELAEALEAAVLGDEDALRTELVQLAATVTAHVQAIDRRKAQR